MFTTLHSYLLLLLINSISCRTLRGGGPGRGGSPHLGGTLGFFNTGGRSPTASPAHNPPTGLPSEAAGLAISTTVSGATFPTTVQPTIPQVPTPSPGTMNSSSPLPAPPSPVASPEPQAPLPTVATDVKTSTPVPQKQPMARTDDEDSVTNGAVGDRDYTASGLPQRVQSESSKDHDEGVEPELQIVPTSKGRTSVKKGPHTKESKGRLRILYTTTIDTFKGFATAERMHPSHVFSLFNVELKFRDSDHEWNMFQHVKKLEFRLAIAQSPQAEGDDASDEDGDCDELPAALAGRDLKTEYDAYKARHGKDALANLKLERAVLDDKLSSTMNVRQRRKLFQKLKAHIESEVMYSTSNSPP